MGAIQIITRPTIISQPDENMITKANEAIQQSDILKSLLKNRQPDLLYMRDIFVTSGMNLNDDVFLISQIEDAVLKRNTITFKPVNFAHNQSDIIGVMVSASILDLEGKPIKADQIVGLGPAFHVQSISVLYRALFPEKINKIIAKAQENKLFVSMQAYFQDYDYLLIDAKHDRRTLQGGKIYKRNEATSFLDEHLKANDGSGMYKGKRIGRVLRNILFAGKGVVDKPANPDSIVDTIVANAEKNEENKKFGVTNSRKLEQKNNDVITEDSIMSIEELKSVKAERDVLKEKLEKAYKELRDANVQSITNTLKEKEQAYTQLQKQQQTLAEKVEKLEEALKELQSTSKTLEQEKVSANEKVKELTEELETLSKEKLMLARITEANKALSEHGYDQKFIDSISQEFVGLTDQAFKACIQKYISIAKLMKDNVSIKVETQEQSVSAQEQQKDDGDESDTQIEVDNDDKVKASINSKDEKEDNKELHLSIAKLLRLKKEE